MQGERERERERADREPVPRRSSWRVTRIKLGQRPLPSAERTASQSESEIRAPGEPKPDLGMI